MRLRRRDLLRHGALSAVAGAMPFVVSRRAGALGFGALQADPNGILDLPPGFSYSMLEVAGAAMSDGYLVPYRPDGMAAFDGPNGTLVLMRNHELSSELGSGGYGPDAVPAESYDPNQCGGVTRLVLDATTFARVSSNLVLTGTSRNCSGGPSPWGWLSCEESTLAGHGYVFLCATDADSVRAPNRIVSYGRLYHEGVAIEPGTNAAFITEDRTDGCLYRFLPDDPSAPFAGKLQALAVVGQTRLSTAAGLTPGQTLDIAWVDIGDPDSASDGLRFRATDAGAATFYRLEGITQSDGVIYAAATFGGNAGFGQVFAIRPTHDGGTLTLLGESPGSEILNGPDNLTVAPWGDVVVAEDGSNPYRYLRGLTADGRVYDIARSNRGELAGVCFSPDGRALFVNIQDIGATLVITGPFDDFDPSGGFGGQTGEAGQGAGASAGSGATTGTSGSSGAGAGNGGGSAEISGGTSGSGSGTGGAGSASGGPTGGGTGPGAAGGGGRSGATDGGRTNEGAGSTSRGGTRARIERPGLHRDNRVKTDPGCGKR